MSYLNPALYTPGIVRVGNYPRTEPCGTLISVEGQEDRRCDVLVHRGNPQKRCDECRERRKALTARKAERKAGR